MFKKKETEKFTFKLGPQDFVTTHLFILVGLKLYEKFRVRIFSEQELKDEVKKRYKQWEYHNPNADDKAWAIAYGKVFDGNNHNPVIKGFFSNFAGKSDIFCIPLDMLENVEQAKEKHTNLHYAAFNNTVEKYKVREREQSPKEPEIPKKRVPWVTIWIALSSLATFGILLTMWVLGTPAG